MIVGYVRALATDESLDLQIEALKRAGADPVLVDDKERGVKAEHPERERAESLLGEGDTLVVESLDRLGLCVREMVKMLDGLGRRGVGFRSLKENIDTTTDTSKSLSFMCAALIECERALARERSAVGRAAARDLGRLGGRKHKLDEKERSRAVALYRDSHSSIADICRKFGISRPTLYRYLQ